MNNQTKGALLAHGPLGLFLSSTTPIPNPITPESVHELVKLAALNAETLERFEVALHSALMLWVVDTSTPSPGPARTPDSVEQRVRDAMVRVERAVSDRTNVVLEAARLHAAPVPQQAQLLEVRDEDPELTKVLEELDELTINFGPRDRCIQVLLKHLRLAQMRAQSESHLARVEARRADDCVQRAQLAEAQLREVSADRDIRNNIARTNADKAAARIRELEAERDKAEARGRELEALLPPGVGNRGGAVGEGSWSVFAQKVTAERDEAQARADKAEADLAETRTQLARLREAGSATERLFSYSDSMQQFVLPANARVIPALGALRAALNTPGPPLEPPSLEQHAAAVEALAQRVQKAEAALDALESENKALRDRVRASEAETHVELAQLREAAGDLVRKARYGTDRVEDYQRVEAALARNVTPAPIDAWLEQLIASATGVDEAMAVLLTLVRDGVAPSDPELFDKTRAAARTVARAKLARETPK